VHKDDSGQFLLLSAIIISIVLVVLLIYINQSSIAGHSSSDSIMSFPKNDLRDISGETADEVYYLGTTEDTSTFNASVAQYAGDIQNLYKDKGTLVDISCNAVVNGTAVKNATVLIFYNDGETTYDENSTISMT
jgi:hypothetical protein